MKLSAFATVRLNDPDTAFIAKANALAVSPSGDVFVTEMFSRRVLRFDAGGKFVEAIGRRGGGPNEFEGPYWLTSLDTNTVAVVDLLRRQIVLWDLALRSARALLPIPGLTSPLVESGGHLYAASADVAAGSAGLRWRSPSGEPERLGRVLDVYREPLAAVWGHVALAVTGDSIVFFGGRSEYLIFADLDWNLRDSIPISRRSRRGIPKNAGLSLGPGQNIYDVGDQLSQPFGLWSLSGGRFAVFHLDARVLSNATVSGKVFMTVLSKQGARRCVDIPVPTTDSTSIPRLAVVGDTLMVLDHFVVADKAVAEIRKYRISGDLC